MKIFLHDLKEKTSLDLTYDYQNEINEIVDILAIKPANIHIDINYLEEEIIFDLTVNVDLELACSKTLKPVPYHMEITEKVVFGDSEDADFIITNPIELSDIIFGYIISEKPFTIYHPDAKEILFEKEKSPHPAFADLDKLLKKIGGEQMAVPFRRTGKTAKRKRRTHYKLTAPALVVCPQTGEFTLPHRVTPNSGYYKGQQVLTKKQSKED